MKSIYINHIPRTGGTTLSRMLYSSGIGNTGLNVFTPQISAYQKKEFNEQNILNSHLIMGHYGIAPQIFNKDIKVITLLRNPINQVVSMFSKLYVESKKIDQVSIDFDLFRNSNNKDNVQDLFREWLFSDSSNMYTNNGQIYNIINTKYPFTFDINNKEKTNFESSNIVNGLNAKNAIDSLLFVGTTEKIYDSYVKIINIINNEFNLNLFSHYKKGQDNAISYSKEIISTMTKYESDYILSNSSIDYEYWEKAL